MARLVFDLDRRKQRLFDWTTFSLVIILSCISLLFIFSATHNCATGSVFSKYFLMQLFAVVSGSIIYFIFFSLDYRALARWGTLFYYVILVLLVFTLITGSIAKGGQRWISLGFIRFQPSELAKLFFPVFFATTIASADDETSKLPRFLPVLTILALSFLLILKQPDLGTSLIVLFSGILLLWLAHIGRLFFILFIGVGAISAPIVWSHLKPYQKTRVLVYLGGGASNKERYQIEQSQIAIGSGGFWGKGYLKGTQTSCKFLPESRTDFIFAVIGEETGFVGAATVIAIFCILFLRMLLQISAIGNVSAQFLAIGLITPLILSTVINICMVLGLLPVVGIPLPFVSYGGTHLWMGFAALGWCSNIIARATLVR